MMTPNDVAQHRFATSRFSGYNTNDVDDFLDQLTADYTALYKENAVLKSKMKVLVDKIAEYRATEDDMRTTLLSARKTADNIVAEAEEKQRQMLLEAENEVGVRRMELRRDIENSEAQLAAARQSTLDFASGMRALVAQQQSFLDRQVEFLDRLSEIEAPPAPNKPDDTANSDAPERSAESLILDDKELAAKMSAAEAAAEASPETAYEQSMPAELNDIMQEADNEPTRRVVDLSSMDMDQDYQV